MPRRSKGPRLYLRRGREDRRTADVWVIRDGASEFSTGCGPDSFGEAEKALGDYITRKWAEGASDPVTEAQRRSDPTRVLVSEVVAYYAQHKAPKVADPLSAKYRLEAILAFFGADDTLADVKRSTCEAYVVWRTAQPVKSYTKNVPRLVSAEAARRELEDLSSAIGYWDGEYHLTHRPKVHLPEKQESPRDALTRSQAAALLWAALGWRKQADGRWKRLRGSAAANRQHMRRFILIGLYTGTRPGVIPKLLWHESATQAFTDMDDGVIYRRGRSEKDHRTKRRPMVRMPDRLLAHMARWKRMDDAFAARVNEKRVKVAASTRAVAEPPLSITSVVHHGGKPLRGKVRRSFESCVRDAGLDPRITPHWMRHTCATWLMEADVPLWDAAAYAGMTSATLEKCYGHHRPSHQRKARNALGNRRAG